MTAQAAYMWSQDDWGDANREAGRDGPPHLGSPASANNTNNNKKKKKNSCSAQKRDGGGRQAPGRDTPIRTAS